jgi:hypothetical protein
MPSNRSSEAGSAIERLGPTDTIPLHPQTAGRNPDFVLIARSKSKSLDSWVRRYPDVHVQTVAARQGGTRPIENHSDSIQLAVVGSADAEQVARLVWPEYHPVLGDSNRSVLLIRH